ncbi:chymotrypsin-2-like [Nomia melanderi]|uniref:chymotrypsin-2-like n=1 Tax=Nomia melanderi TaxID=2448451 RepID=UPI00130425E4|nr:chymotrypsin-2-like [Nomia melanderi]
MALALVSLFAVLAVANAGVLFNFDPRVVDGEDAKPGEIPYQVSLQTIKKRLHFCGGSILNSNYVLTAAHCLLFETADNIQVIAGTVDVDDRVSVHKVEKMIVHEKFSMEDSFINDIALLKVKTPFSISPRVSTVPLPKMSDVIPADTPAIVSGWGALAVNGPAPKKLQKALIFITEQKICKNAYIPMNMTVHDSHICANYPPGEKGACNGDSGGPLTVNGKIVGIVSWSYWCALPNYPTVYTRVTSFLDWIQEHAV